MVSFYLLHDFDIHFIIICSFTKVPCNLGHVRRRKVDINMMSVVRLRTTKSHLAHQASKLHSQLRVDVSQPEFGSHSCQIYFTMVWIQKLSEIRAFPRLKPKA